MNDDNVKKRLCRSLAQRFAKGEHDNDQFKQDLDAYILNEYEQLAAGKDTRQGKHRRSIEPLLKARRPLALPETQRELGRFISTEIGQLNYHNEDAKTLQQYANNKKLEEKIAERDSLLSKLGRPIGNGPNVQALRKVQAEVTNLRVEVKPIEDKERET